MLARINRLALPRAASRQLSVAHNKLLVDSPYTGGVVAEIPLASEREAAEVVAKAAAAQRAWKETSLDSRKHVVQQFLKSVEHNRDAIAKVVAVLASPVTVMVRQQSSGSDSCVFPHRKFLFKWGSRFRKLKVKLMA